MRCFGCGYTLWNLTEPQCPECGRGFDLRDYRFPAGQVAFACPKCGHRHGGAGEYGQPTDRGTCVCRNCGEVIDTPSMQVILLADGVEAEPARLTPWERRDTLGFWRGWFDTVVLSLFQPGRLGESIGPWTWAPRAAWFAGVNVLLPAFALMVMSLAFSFVVLVVNNRGGTAVTPGVLISVVNLLWINAGVTVLVGAAISVLVPVAHNVLVLVGARRGGMGVTGAAMGYGYGPIVLATLPVLGLMVAIVWILASSIVVLSRAQQVSMGRAALAVLALPIGIIPVAIILYALMRGL